MLKKQLNKNKLIVLLLSAYFYQAILYYLNISDQPSAQFVPPGWKAPW